MDRRSQDRRSIDKNRSIAGRAYFSLGFMKMFLSPNRTNFPNLGVPMAIPLFFLLSCCKSCNCSEKTGVAEF